VATITKEVVVVNSEAEVEEEATEEDIKVLLCSSISKDLPCLKVDSLNSRLLGIPNKCNHSLLEWFLSRTSTL
jgi:hypothetical protein